MKRYLSWRYAGFLAFLFFLSISASACAKSIRPHILPLPAANRTIWTNCYGVTFCRGFFSLYPHPSADAGCGANTGKLNQLILFIKLGTVNDRVLYLS
ncbi:hypothetical protein [Serratia sp. CY76391]|uniref:hypothetical protein n=1 Tax=Serratia sp. CY76391 TaxID=3383681 RepID=UPI003F9F948A